MFLLAGACSLAAGLLGSRCPTWGRRTAPSSGPTGSRRCRSVIWEHRRTLLTLGVAVIVIGASRSMRNGLMPLWADHIGISASTTSLVFAVSALVDIVMFYPGGWVMDRQAADRRRPDRARRGARLPGAPPGLDRGGSVAVMVVISLANGLGSGIVMTMGADTAPVAGRPQYLGAWRLCGDIGVSGGPLLVSVLSLVAPLARVAVASALLGLAGSGWVAYWTRDLDRSCGLRGASADPDDDLVRGRAGVGVGHPEPVLARSDRSGCTSRTGRR